MGPASGALKESDVATVELDVIPVGDDGWRVSIRGADAGNPFALLGFITLVGARYQLCVLARPGEAIDTATLDEAVELLRPSPLEVQGILAGIRPARPGIYAGPHALGVS